MFEYFLKFLGLHTGRPCTIHYCLAALLFLAGPSAIFAQSDPSNVDVQLFRDINNAQTQFKTSLIGVSDNSVYPILIAAPVALAAYGLAADQNERLESGVLLGSSELLAYSIGYVLKESVRRERPVRNFDRCLHESPGQCRPVFFSFRAYHRSICVGYTFDSSISEARSIHPCICMGRIGRLRENLFWTPLSIRCPRRRADWNCQFVPCV